MADNLAIADKLDEARALIEKGWCQRAFAKDANGKKVFSWHPSAVCWCAIGAINATEPNNGGPWRYLEKVVGRSPDTWNDAPERTQAEVIEAFRKAAELARAVA